MPAVLISVMIGLAFLLGFLWPRGRKVSNPRPHPTADREYYSILIQNETHLFTEEQVRDARDRAIKHKLQ